MPELAAIILVIDGAAAPPKASPSMAEMVSNCSSGGEEGVIIGTAGIIVAPGFDVTPTSAKGPFDISCRASMSLWM